ncbi:ABC transporter ATP-binding protein [Streptomyces sp. NPDC092296]|uniref:ABC transporter ATP-binding protein n=1 Tax=Streptomyces sp. NPDC092296 TaxID=3366012 RepID=UPI003830C805
MSGTGRTLLPVATPARTRQVAAELLRPRLRPALAAVLAVLAEAAVGLAGPLALGRIVDAVQHGGGAGRLVPAAAVLLGAAAAQAALATAGRTLVAQVGESALARLRERVVGRVLALPSRRIEQAGSGDLAARVGDDVSVVAAAVRGSLPDFAGAALTIGFTALGLAVLDWRFAVAGLCALPIQAATLRWYLRRSGPLYAAQRVAGGERAQQLLESIGGAATVRVFRLGEEHTRRVAERSAQAMDLAVRATTLRSRFYGRLNAAEFTGLGMILATGFWLVHSGGVGLGAATSAALLFIRLFDPVNALLALVSSVQEAGAALARLVGAAELPPDGQPEPPQVTARTAAPRVRVRGVSHAYRAGRPVLDGIDLDLAPGEQVTLVGASGAGKSTLARIVAGTHPPTGGRVEVGGAPPDARDGTGRPAVFLLDQDTHVFAGPLAEDLRLARPDAAEAELRAALERAGALAWAAALPQGLDTVVGAGGVRLTPVQAQQLALARLALADPPVAVLDEAAAEAGSEGARVLEAAAREILRGRTALVVAHRLAQAATADRVVVLEAGRVVEDGPHDALLAAGGRYAALWSAWSGRAHGPGAAGG